MNIDSKATVGIHSNVINGIEYSINATTLEATVIGHTGSIKDLVIPSSITVNNIQYTVIAIGTNRIITLELPDCVTNIGVDAFRLNAIEDITIGESVVTIGTRAFMNNRIKNLAIPDSVITINESAFEANRLTSLEIGQSVITCNC